MSATAPVYVPNAEQEAMMKKRNIGLIIGFVAVGLAVLATITLVSAAYINRAKAQKDAQRERQRALQQRMQYENATANLISSPSA